MKTELNLEFYKLTYEQKKSLSKKGANIKIDDYFFDISEQQFDFIDERRFDDKYIDECARTCIDRLMEICKKHEVSIDNIKELNIFIIELSDIETIYYLCHACQILKIDYINIAFIDDHKGYYKCKVSTDLYRSKEICLALDKDSYINSYTNMILFDEDINASNYDQETLTEIIRLRMTFIWRIMNILSNFTTSNTFILMIPENIYKYLDEFTVIASIIIGSCFDVEIHCINKSGLEKIAKFTL